MFKKIQTLRFLSLFFIGITVQGCSQSAGQVSKSDSGWMKFETSEFEVQYPASWDLDESGQMKSSFILFTHLTDEKDDFKENINLLIQDLSVRPMDLDEYVKLSEGQIETLVTNGELLSSERLSDGKRDFQKVVYTGQQGIYSLKYVQYYWVFDNRAQILTFTSEQDQYSKFHETGTQILESFKLKE